MTSGHFCRALTYGAQSRQENTPTMHEEQQHLPDDGTPIRESTPARIKPPTRADVARLANVSGATVSYVLNDVQDARISEATKERVLAAAARLGYVQDELASSLRSGRNDLVLLPFFDWPYNQSSIYFLQELARQLDRMGYSVLLRFFGQKDKRDLARRIASFHPAGVIVMSEELSSKDSEILARNGVRAVLVYGGTTGDPARTIPVDFTPAGELVGQYLLGKGHRRLAGVVPRDPRIVRVGMQRFEGLRRVAEMRGILIERVDLDYDIGQAAVLATKWSRGPRPSAVFAYNDEYAFLLLTALQDAGLRVPDDIALVGCDDLPLCELTRPRLTSLHNRAPERIRALVTYFDALIQHQPPDQPPAQPPDLGLSFEMAIRESA
jgi:DNA-binding LacI/PurR family transcriptional regulator